MLLFRHYKGGIYEFVGEALHSETNEALVVYKSQDGRFFVRPKTMFYENITVDGKSIPRFEAVNQQ